MLVRPGTTTSHFVVVVDRRWLIVVVDSKPFNRIPCMSPFPRPPLSGTKIGASRRRRWVWSSELVRSSSHCRITDGTRAYTGACPHYTVNTGRLEAPKATAREHGYSVHTDRKLLSLFSFTVRHCSVICGRSSASGRLKFFRTLPDEPHPIYTESIPETADMQLRGRWTKTDGGRGSFV